MIDNEYWKIVNDMETGDLLDHLVAQKVMGWEVHCRNTAWYVEAAKKDKVVDRLLQDVARWHPTTRRDQAWDVLDIIKGNYNDVCISMPIGGRTTVTIEPADHGPQMTITGKTMQEAICKAALLDAEWRRKK